MRQLLGMLAVASALLTGAVRGALPPEQPPAAECTVQTDSYSYDLRPLSLSHTDYIIRTQPSSPTDPVTEYRFNVCRNLVTAPSLSGPPQIAVMGAFRQADNDVRGDSLGSFDTHPYLVRPPNQEGPATLALTYQTGSPCKAHPEVPLSSIIEFVCDKSAHPHSGDAGPRLVGTLSEGCAVVFSFPTSYACPVATRPRGLVSALAILIPVFLILIIVFLIASFAYRRFVQNSRGPDQLPNLSSGPQHLRNCVDFASYTFGSIKNSAKNAMGSSPERSGYGHVRLWG